MIGEDMQKFSGSRVMRISAIGRVPIRNLPKKRKERNVYYFLGFNIISLFIKFYSFLII